MIIPVILCGGVGSRLWPLSRENNPKQFLNIDGNKSLFQETVLRVSDKHVFMNPIIICRENYKFKVASELEAINIKPYAILLEPCSKNTAPAISAAALYVKQQFNNSQNLLVLPSDHIITHKEKFISYIKKFKTHTTKGLITFGITPNHPATGYGYIKKGQALEKGIHAVQEFTEKPNESTAKKFLKAGDYFWNSGIFLIDNLFYIKELKKINPTMLSAIQHSIDKSKKVFDFIALSEGHFSKIKNIPVDIAIFEKTKNALLCPIKIDWFDLGSWNSFYIYMKKSSDKNGNILIGDKIHSRNCKNTFVYSKLGSHIVVNGVENACIINTKDATLITNKDSTEDVKKIYSHLTKTGANIVKDSSRYYRPWGHYETVLETSTCKVKRISIMPHQQISLQYHMKRSEHWVITKGIATVTKGKESFQLKENESTYISPQEIHKIVNNSSNILELIEVQIGEVLSEEDIIRLEDKYGRVTINNKHKIHV